MPPRIFVGHMNRGDLLLNQGSTALGPLKERTTPEENETRTMTTQMTTHQTGTREEWLALRWNLLGTVSGSNPTMSAQLQYSPDRALATVVAPCTIVWARASARENVVQWPSFFRPRRIRLPGLRNRALRKRTRTLLKEEFPNGAITELTTVRD